MLDIDLDWVWILLDLALVIGGILIAALMAGDVLRQRRAPARTAAWLLTLLFLPYFGVLLYLLFGARKLPRPRYRIGRLALSSMAVDEQSAHPLDLLLRGLGVPGAVGGNAVRIHKHPEEALSALLELIASASTRVLVDIYGFDEGAAGKRVLGALVERARAGVEVKVLVDDIGSMALRSAMRRLKRAGGSMVRFKPVSQLFLVRMVNLRNHRKIIVADGARAWTGGRNIGDPYLSSLSHAHAWEDLSCTIAGPAVRVFEDIAMSDWRYATGEKIVASEPTAHALEPGHTRVQVVPSGPDLRDDTWYAALLCACFTAKRRLWLITPYFVPDEALMNALNLAARRGIEVRVFVPQRSDNWLVDRVRMSYLRELSACGAEVYRYQPRMLHAKALLMDDSAAALGTANVDARSLFLNYEVMTVLYDHADIAALGAYINALLPDCVPGVPRVGWLREAMAAPFRLLAPLL